MLTFLTRHSPLCTATLKILRLLQFVILLLCSLWFGVICITNGNIMRQTGKEAATISAAAALRRFRPQSWRRRARHLPTSLRQETSAIAVQSIQKVPDLHCRSPCGPNLYYIHRKKEGGSLSQAKEGLIFFLSFFSLAPTEYVRP